MQLKSTCALKRDSEKKMETFKMESCVRGYHIYKEIWEAVVCEELQCQHIEPIPLITMQYQLKEKG